MFNTMTLTKAFAALCGALLVFLFINWGANALFSMDSGHGGEQHQAFIIPVATAEAPAAAGEAAAGAAGGAEAEVPFADVLASADVAAGEKVFSKCRACHKVDGANATGPHLDGVVGRAVATVDGFTYSNAMKAHGGEWTPEELSKFLTSPKDSVPGTKMIFAGLPKVQDRANLIAYLESVSK